MPRFLAYRHCHEETNTAAVVTVALAELGLIEFDPELRRQELTLHGLLQRGHFQQGRGLLIANALQHLRDHGMRPQILHEAPRTAALRGRLISEEPGFDFQLLTDLGSPPPQPLLIERDFREGVSTVLLESRAARARLPLHLLLVRRDRDRLLIMNSETGENHVCSDAQLAGHLSTPVSFGAVAFAGSLYLYTGIAIRLDF